MEQQYCNIIMPSFAPPSSQYIPERSDAGYGEKKKLKLTSAQRDLLETLFSEGIRLDAARKSMLSKELGLDPRQVAVWFQNRRSRWKAKQLELSYHALQFQLHAVSLENHRLRHQVVELRAMLMEQAATNQISMDCNAGTDVDQTARNMLAATTHGGSAAAGGALHLTGLPESYNNYKLNPNGIDDDFPLASYWAAYPPC